MFTNSIDYWRSCIEAFNNNYGFVYFIFQFCLYAFYILKLFFLDAYMHTLKLFVLLVNRSIYHYLMFLFTPSDFLGSEIHFDINVVTL